MTSSARHLGLRRFHLTVGSTALREICLLWKFVRSEPQVGAQFNFQVKLLLSLLIPKRVSYPCRIGYVWFSELGTWAAAVKLLAGGETARGARYLLKGIRRDHHTVG